MKQFTPSSKSYVSGIQNADCFEFMNGSLSWRCATDNVTFLEGYVRGALNVVCSTSVNWSCSKSEQIGNLKISSMDLEILDFIASHLIANFQWLASHFTFSRSFFDELEQWEFYYFRDFVSSFQRPSTFNIIFYPLDWFFLIPLTHGTALSMTWSFSLEDINCPKKNHDVFQPSTTPGRLRLH